MEQLSNEEKFVPENASTKRSAFTQTYQPNVDLLSIPFI